MKCHQVRQLLTEYLGGSIADSLRQTIGEHLFSCSDCRQEAYRINPVVSALKEAAFHCSRFQTSPGFNGKLYQAIHQDINAHPLRRWLGWMRRSFRRTFGF